MQNKFLADIGGKSIGKYVGGLVTNIALAPISSCKEESYGLGGNQFHECIHEKELSISYNKARRIQVLYELEQYKKSETWRRRMARKISLEKRKQALIDWHKNLKKNAGNQKTYFLKTSGELIPITYYNAWL